MTRFPNRLLRIAVFGLLVLGVSASASSTPTRRLKQASGPITALAIDGSRVVYSTDPGDVYVWDVPSGRTWHPRLSSGSDFPPVTQVAIAGRRVAWIRSDVAGNSMETNENLVTTTLGSYGARTLAHAYRDFDLGVGQWHGDWISGLVGSGKTLVVSRWTTTPDAGGPTEAMSNARLSLIGVSAGRLRTLASGNDVIVSGGVDAHGVAVARPSGTVAFYSFAGTLLWQTTSSPATAIAMGGGRVAVLTKTKTLEVYDSRTGAFEHRWPIKTRSAYLQVGHLQAYGRIAVFSVDPRYASRNLRILDLETGKSLILPSRPRSAWNDASVGPLGVVYAVNDYRAYGGRHPTGTLVFLSAARVLDGIARGHL